MHSAAVVSQPRTALVRLHLCNNGRLDYRFHILLLCEAAFVIRNGTFVDSILEGIVRSLFLVWLPTFVVVSQMVRLNNLHRRIVPSVVKRRLFTSQQRVAFVLDQKHLQLQLHVFGIAINSSNLSTAVATVIVAVLPALFKLLFDAIVGK